VIALLVSGYYLPAVWAIPMFVIAAGLTGLGLYDLAQPLHSVRRNYPIIGHLRWFFEEIRPEIRQYLMEDDQVKVPFSRAQRSLVYARAKNESSDRAFGTLLDVYQNGYEFIAHSTRPAPAADPSTFRVPIGGNECTQPYPASIFNISAMSFGSLSANAILALNKGAKMGGFAHDTGEGSISPYHREHGGDLIWEIGSGYFGCRTGRAPDRRPTQRHRASAGGGCPLPPRPDLVRGPHPRAGRWRRGVQPGGRRLVVARLGIGAGRASHRVPHGPRRGPARHCFERRTAFVREQQGQRPQPAA
jgi:hypothetical protein